ncbi:cytochrome c556 [Psychrobacter sp. PL15]|jgi:cytochrome c556|uniref:c-type cytochrome n=1 Tax=unclassified Psychrobacter TaxID=196806 RepID=UPI001AE9AAFD|nr:cytochrome c [Psychrobacter sp. PL15]MEC5210048.1 cytochrome c556 [Psychrobacter sp. PL15]
MSRIHSNKSLNSIVGITLMTALLGLTACSAPANPDVKARQNIMKNYGDAMGVMGDMMKAPDTFDAAIVKEQAAFLAKESKSPWRHFEDQEAVGNATEAVWSNADDFRTKSENFQQATAELNNAAQTATSVDGFRPAFGAVGKSCKSCHDDYQVKKED